MTLGESTVDVDGSGSGLLDRVSQLPYVTETFSFLSKSYTDYGRNSGIKLVRDGVSYVEGTLASTYEVKAKPLLAAHSDTLRTIDTYACSKWDLAEKTVVDATASVQQKKDALVRTVNSTTQRAESTLLYCPKTILNAADAAVDYILPTPSPAEDEDEDEHAGDAARMAVDGEEAGEMAMLSSRPSLGDGVGLQTAALLHSTSRLTTKLKSRATNSVRTKVSEISSQATDAAQSIRPMTTYYFNEALHQLHELAKDEPEGASVDGSKQSSRFGATDVSDSTILYFSPRNLRRRALARARKSLKAFARPVAQKCVLAIDGTTKSIEMLMQLIEELKEHAQESFVTVSARTSNTVENTKEIITSTVYIRLQRTASNLAQNETVIALSQKLFDLISSLGVTIPDAALQYFPHHPAHPAHHPTRPTFLEIEDVSDDDDNDDDDTTNDNDDDNSDDDGQKTGSGTSFHPDAPTPSFATFAVPSSTPTGQDDGAGTQQPLPKDQATVDPIDSTDADPLSADGADAGFVGASDSQGAEAGGDTVAEPQPQVMASSSAGQAAGKRKKKKQRNQQKKHSEEEQE